MGPVVTKCSATAVTTYKTQPGQSYLLAHITALLLAISDSVQQELVRVRT
jgi:hypothetical protein